MNQEKTPSPPPNSETIFFKPGEDLPNTTQPTKTLPVVPDAPKKLEKEFCCICHRSVSGTSFGMQDSIDNYYCIDCY